MLMTRTQIPVHVSPPQTRPGVADGAFAPVRGHPLPRLQGPLTFRPRPPRQRHAEVDYDRGDRLARRSGPMDRLGPLLILNVSRPVTMSRRVDSGDHEPMGGHAVERTGYQSRRLLVHAAAVSRQKQW